MTATQAPFVNRIAELTGILGFSLDEESIRGQSPAWRDAEKWMRKAAQSSRAPVLLLGEEGTGKEVAAREIHSHSGRAGKPLEVLDCGALQKELVGSELFGHQKGAFTGADHNRIGLIAKANGGTLLIDEVGELPLDVQPKLLRFLQEGTIRIVGTNDYTKVDVWVIAATNRDLDAEVEAGRFRKDLRDRLRVVQIRLPALRNRREDIPALADFFLKKYSKMEHVKYEAFTSRSLELLCGCDWPGNVRALETFIESFCVYGADQRDLVMLLTERFGSVIPIPVPVPVPEVVIPDNLDEIVWAHVQRVLEKTGGNRVEAAKLLGIGERTIFRMLSRNKESVTAGSESD